MSVNIPRDVEDPYYRYKMPVLKAKVEGRGNGIKTLIENMSDIARDLDRRPDYPTKFFGFELGALTKCETQNDRYIVNGKREAEDLAKVLDSFIERYVLCRKCRNPETDMKIKNGEILLACRACGNIAACDSSHKLSTYIIKNPPNQFLYVCGYSQRHSSPRNSLNSAVAAKAGMTKAQRREAKKKARNAADADDDDEEDNDDWAVSTAPEFVSQRRLALLGGSDRLEGADDSSSTPASGDKEKRLVHKIKPGTNPIGTLSSFFADPPSNEEIVSQVKELAEANQWSESQFFKILFGSMFPKPFPTKNFILKARYIRLFTTTAKQQKVVLYCVEKLCQMDSSAISHLPSILNCFWEERVLDEETINKWYRHTNKHLPPKLSAKIRSESKVFVDWLENAEEPEDDW